jgi:TonB family protein
MVARLLKPPVPAPVEVPEEITGEMDGIDTGEEELSDPDPDPPPDREDGASVRPAALGVSASLAAGSGAGPVPAVGRLRLDDRLSPRAEANAVAVPARRLSRGESAGRLDIFPSTSTERRERDLRSAVLEIRERIESKKTYPLMARRRGWEGDVLVEIVLGGAGELEGLRLLRLSGFPLLDRATLTAVRAAVPFPPVPGRVKIPVSYRLVPD